MFQLEALQAQDGDCLLLHYDANATPGLILIDGGSAGVCPKWLKPRLESLRGRSPLLKLRMVIVSHIDADHITGVVDLFRYIGKLRDNSQPSPYDVTSLWHNSFGNIHGPHIPRTESAAIGAALNGEINGVPGLDEDVLAVVASVRQGDELQRLATHSTIINKEASGKLICAPEGQPREYKIADGLTFTILGPREKELNSLKKEWNKSKEKSDAEGDDAVAADYLNRTVPNLSSIVILATKTEAKGKRYRMLLTGDAGGDKILDSLERQKLLDGKGKIKVNLLKVQHHGSNHSADANFFRRVLADRYVISGNGKHGIPHPDVLRWISEARGGEEIDVYMTNRRGVKGLTKMLDKFLSEEKKKEPKHRYHFRKDDEPSITAVVA